VPASCMPPLSLSLSLSLSARTFALPLSLGARFATTCTALGGDFMRAGRAGPSAELAEQGAGPA
jgi:hypothetical protein